ncbi:MAG: hypothetical protein M3220_07905 [Chloroflexota bacterium]|nr:hypothetical protein [Chloroflexota bacterium]
MKGNTEMMPHPERDKYRAGRFDMLRYIKGDRDRNRGNAPSLNGALHERD